MLYNQHWPKTSPQTWVCSGSQARIHQDSNSLFGRLCHSLSKSPRVPKEDAKPQAKASGSPGEAGRVQGGENVRQNELDTGGHVPQSTYKGVTNSAASGSGSSAASPAVTTPRSPVVDVRMHTQTEAQMRAQMPTKTQTEPAKSARATSLSLSPSSPPAAPASSPRNDAVGIANGIGVFLSRHN